MNLFFRLWSAIALCVWLTACAQQTVKTDAEDTVAQRDPQAESTLYGREGTEYKVLFTDPECQQYDYTKDVLSVNNTKLSSKPKNVFCRNKNDLGPSGIREESPQHQLVEWINDKDTEEIIFTYLSFRNKAVKNALCERVKQGNFRVNFVMSSTEDTSIAQELKACNPARVTFKLRGMEGDLGYAHNKIFVVLQRTYDMNKEWRSQINKVSDRIKIVFSSGNMTSGPVMHHENWHFIDTDAASYFAQMHLCALYSEWNDATGRSRNTYMNAISACRKDLQAKGLRPESDIKVFFVPGEGEGFGGTVAQGQSAADYMVNGDGFNTGIRNASKIWIGAHRFFYSKMINALKQRMNSFANKPEIRITVDDDTYYKATDPEYTIGDTDPAEWFHIQDLVQKGAKVRLMESNGEEHQLHHSKYLLFFKGEKPSALLCGAANLTGAGFNKNWENIYYITAPQILNDFKVHYEKFWYPDEKLNPSVKMTSKATPVNLLPKKGLVTESLEP
jgi:hypothetical protein